MEWTRKSIEMKTIIIFLLVRVIHGCLTTPGLNYVLLFVKGRFM